MERDFTKFWSKSILFQLASEDEAVRPIILHWHKIPNTCNMKEERFHLTHKEFNPQSLVSKAKTSWQKGVVDLLS